MGIQFIPKGAPTTLSGQPVGGNTNEGTGGQSANNGGNTNGGGSAAGKPNIETVSAPVSTNAEGTQNQTSTPASGAAATTPVVGTPAAVNIPPEAVKQISTLSAANRELRTKVEQAEAKQAENDAKFARLAELEAAITSPKKYLALAKKTLEDVAQDVLSDDPAVADPRVDEMKPVVEGLQKKLDDITAQRLKEQETAVNTERASKMAAGEAHTKTVVESQPNRWPNIAKDAGIGKRVLNAAIAIVARDYSEVKDADGNITREAKPVDMETSNKILEDCLDEEEALAEARIRVAARKNGQAASVDVPKKGIELRDGVDVKPASPSPTIDARRGPTRTLTTVQRGPTDVRTAKARAMRIATGEE